MMSTPPLFKLRVPAQTWLMLGLILPGILTGCSNPASSAPDLLPVSILVDGETHHAAVLPGSLVDAALARAGVELTLLDAIDPPISTAILESTEIRITRVSEQYITEEITVPFETQTVVNETLPDGQSLRVQAGVNGLLENTYRIRLEDGRETSRTLYQQKTITAALPEIMMIGSQQPAAAQEFQGSIVYLANGSAWIMQGSSSQRTQLSTGNDLDGRILSLSPDGRWLLYTRRSPAVSSSGINELWLIDTGSPDSTPLDLGIENVIHFAGWRPGSEMSFACSTVEPREAAPGWQANNDLVLVQLNENGAILDRETILEVNPGGVYGWWGTTFAWSPDGKSIAYSGSDSIGIITISNKKSAKLADVLPFRDGSNWVWTPAITWSGDGRTLYYIDHGAQGSTDETSLAFGLRSVTLSTARRSDYLIENNGLIISAAINPDPSDVQRVAWLQARNPQQKDGLFHLSVSDTEGENIQDVFPPAGASGIIAQPIFRQPAGDNTADPVIGLIYEGNIWFVNLETLESSQVTGDGSVTLMDWK